MQYSVSAAARLTGVPANTLRTWERRYGFPRPQRTTTGRRLYDEEDLAAVRRMAALIETGVPAAQAAESALLDEPVPATEPAAAASLPPEVEQLVLAAAQFDEPGARAAIATALEPRDWGQAIAEVLFPALHEAGVRWQHGDVSLTHEHFLSQVVRSELLGAVRDCPAPGGASPIVLACPEGEQHEFGVLALWLLLRQAGVPVLCLGADVPAQDLVAAALQAGSSAVCLSVITTTSLPHAELAARALANARRRIRVFVGGPALLAASDTSAMPGVRLPQDINAAVEVLSGTAGRSGRETR
jgi:DNA-binding transcriptional MerR regulator/methylmalonyl-CoA mutase cobalamin-binding subunit